MYEPKTAYLCIIQYTRDQDREEGVNVGVVVFCPERSYLGVQITALYDRAERFFGSAVDEEEVQQDTESIAHRLLNVEAEHMHTLADLQHFVDTRANQIILTQPRPLTLRQPPDEELLRLFRELVDDRPAALAVPASEAAPEPRLGSLPVPEAPSVVVPSNP